MSGRIEQLAKLAQQFDTLKRSEASIAAERIKIEEAIAVLIPGPDKGQKTTELPNGDKLIVKRDLTFKADLAAISRETINGPCFHEPIISKTTRIFDIAGYEWYRDNNPEIFALISKHVEVKPKKTAVTFKRKE